MLLCLHKINKEHEQSTFVDNSIKNNTGHSLATQRIQTLPSYSSQLLQDSVDNDETLPADVAEKSNNIAVKPKKRKGLGVSLYAARKVIFIV